MLARVRAQYPTPDASRSEQEIEESSSLGVPTAPLGSWSDGLESANGEFLQPMASVPVDVDYSMMGDMVNAPDYIDWDLWDRMALQNGNDLQLNDWAMDPVLDSVGLDQNF